MNIYNSLLWQKDIDRVLKTMPCLQDLYGKRVLITGIGGLICSAVADLLIRLNETENAQITILAAARTEEKLKARFGEYAAKSYFQFVRYDATDSVLMLNSTADYIIHGASNAFPAMIVKEPVETMMSNFTGLLCLLNYGKTHGTKRLLYISSSEVYGKKNDNQPFKEGEYGFVDLLNARNSYSVGKRAAETLCVSYADEYEVETVIVRPGHIYGPTASIKDNRVSSAWAFAAARGEDIVMKSDGSQVRSYCFCLDAASAILMVLLRGDSKHAYNISNPDSIISIRDAAEILARSGNVRLIMELPSDEEKKGFNPMSNSALESFSLLNLGWKGCFDAETGFSHTVQIIREAAEPGACCEKKKDNKVQEI